MDRWRLAPMLGRSIAEVIGPDPVGSCEAEAWLSDAGYSLLVAIRPDIHYATSWCHRPDDPACRFRVYQCCFRPWRLAGAIEQRRALAPGAPITPPTETDLFLLNEYLSYELYHGRAVPLWLHPALDSGSGVAAMVRTSIRRELGDVIRAGRCALEARWQAQPHRLRAHAARHPRWLPKLFSHSTSLEALRGILESGATLCSAELSGLSGETLARQPRNITCDPPDYFEYVMLLPGDDHAIGDWVVYQRLVDRSPTDPTAPLTWEEFVADFIPAPKLYFSSATLLHHPGVRTDGFHDLKIHTALELAPYLTALVIPDEAPEVEALTDLARRHHLGDRMVLLPTRGLEPTEWATQAYQAALARHAQRGS